MSKILRSQGYKRPHKRGLEQICLPFDFTSAITPAVALAQTNEEMKLWAFCPAANKNNIR